MNSTYEVGLILVYTYDSFCNFFVQFTYDYFCNFFVQFNKKHYPPPFNSQNKTSKWSYLFHSNMNRILQYCKNSPSPPVSRWSETSKALNDGFWTISTGPAAAWCQINEKIIGNKLTSHTDPLSIICSLGHILLVIFGSAKQCLTPSSSVDGRCLVSIFLCMPSPFLCAWSFHLLE